jgi:hypothetical protein
VKLDRRLAEAAEEHDLPVVSPGVPPDARSAGE